MNKPPDETLKQGRNRSWLLVKVAAIDKHLFDLYGTRYTKFRTSNQYKEILNKKCSRVRTKFNKSIDNN